MKNGRTDLGKLFSGLEYDKDEDAIYRDIANGGSVMIQFADGMFDSLLKEISFHRDKDDQHAVGRIAALRNRASAPKKIF